MPAATSSSTREAEAPPPTPRAPAGYTQMARTTLVLRELAAARLSSLSITTCVPSHRPPFLHPVPLQLVLIPSQLPALRRGLV